jgi:hypothetical protein
MEIEGEIINLHKMVNEDTEMIIGYSILIECRKKPNLKLGKCMITQ